MLFNSYAFIFVFLPVTLAVFFALGAHHRGLAAGWLAAASMFFYGWWNPVFVPLLAASITANFAFGAAIARARASDAMRRGRRLLFVAISANLLLLCYFKYAGFLATNLGSITGSTFDLGAIVLPLGISFFTFTQIAFLVDALQGKAREYSFTHYALFVTYFPHLIAGPVLHHREMMPQFGEAATYRIRAENIAVGTTIFLIGLFKKTVLADGIAPHAAPVFAAAASGTAVGFFDAWGGALAYTLQLYFDFSGYSCMAIGLSRLFGIRLPLNFNSPYKAGNIIDFWRRWHMTLSRFLRDYLYVPLGGNRHGPARRYLNLAATMVLGGLWHGAGWTFVAWGALHGAYLIVNHAWRTLRTRLGYASARSTRASRALARTVTLAAVVVGWVIFRADSLHAAGLMLRGMAGLSGATLPEAIANALGPLHSLLAATGIETVPGGGGRFVATWTTIAVLLAIALWAPNTQEIMRRYRPALDAADGVRTVTTTSSGPRRDTLAWQPSVPWMLYTGALGAAALLSLTRVSEFLYFQF